MLNKLLFAGLAGLIAFGAWWGISSGTDAPLLNSEAVVATPGAVNIADGLLSLRAITLSSTIFADPLFRQLVDVGVEIVAEPAGKRNPFTEVSTTTPNVLTPQTVISTSTAPLPVKSPKKR